MPTLSHNPTPKELREAYEQGLEGWIWDKPAQEEWNEFCESQPDPDVELAAIKDTHKDVKRALLYRSREKFDPGAFGKEAQKGPDCTSHGDRNGCDVTRCVEIDIKGEPEEYKARGATEVGYGARGHGGGGSSPGRLAQFKRDFGFLIRINYPGIVDLSTYTYSIGANWGRRGVPESVKQLCKQNPVRKLIVPKSVEQVMDCLSNGYAGHSGQSWACSSRQPENGINTKSGTWNHDMATVGFDATEEIFEDIVFFVPQSWGDWIAPNKKWVKHTDVLGPYPTGMIVVPIGDYDRYFVRSGSIYFYGDVQGFPAKRLPHYGTQNIIA